MPVYLAGSDLNIWFSCIINDLYSVRVPSNSLGGFSLGARSCWAVGTGSGGARAFGAGAKAVRY